MTGGGHGRALALLLGLGMADVAVLNAVVLPPLFAERAGTEAERLPMTAVMAVEEGEPRAGLPAQVAAAGPSAPTPAQAPAEPEELRAVVLFRSGTFWVGREDRTRIAALAEELRGRSIAIEVDGHADAPGSSIVNQRLSQARARAISALLEQAGIDASRIALRAFGEERPSGQGQDRRVEVRLRVAR